MLMKEKKYTVWIYFKDGKIKEERGRSVMPHDRSEWEAEKHLRQDYERRFPEARKVEALYD